MSFELIIFLFTLFGLAGIGTPVGYSIITASIMYFTFGDMDDKIFVDSARSSAAVGVVIGGAFILNYIVISENIPGILTAFLQGIDVSPLVFLILINILVLLLGCFLDATTIILVIVPLFIPVCKALGIDLIHFGVLVVVNSMIGLITPPYGILLFVINAVTGISLKEIISEIWMFIGVLILALIVMMLFPELILWLPEIFGYKGINYTKPNLTTDFAASTIAPFAGLNSIPNNSSEYFVSGSIVISKSGIIVLALLSIILINFTIKFGNSFLEVF